MMEPDRGQPPPTGGSRVDPPRMPNVGSGGSSSGGGASGFATMAGAGQPPSLSTMQRIVRLAEKDDLLLYGTALFGILMPAVMYFFYRTMHGKYHAYQQQKKAAEQRKIAQKRNKRSVTIFYCSSNQFAKRMSYDLAEELDRFDPIVANLSPVDIHRRIKESGKAVFIFLVHGEGATEKEPLTLTTLSAFLDWLDEVRYERLQRSYLAGISFAVFGVGACSNTMADSLHNKLQSMRGTPLYDSPTVANVDEAGAHLRHFAVDLTRQLKQFHCGAFDERHDASVDSAAEEEEEEDSDLGSDVQEEKSFDYSLIVREEKGNDKKNSDHELSNSFSFLND